MPVLRIQEFLNARGLAITDLSRLTGLAEDILRSYTEESIDLNQESAQNLRTISTKLNIPAAKLIRPVDKKAGIRLKVLERAEAQGLTLSQLSEESNVHPLLLAIYSTQVLLKEKWEEVQTQENIGRIAAALDTSPEELSVIQDPPITQLRVNDFLQEKGLSLEDLSLLYDIPSEVFNLLASQPFDFSAISGRSELILIRLCQLLGCPYWCRC